jgi:hypothetical protein
MAKRPSPGGSTRPAPRRGSKKKRTGRKLRPLVFWNPDDPFHQPAGRPFKPRNQVVVKGPARSGALIPSDDFRQAQKTLMDRMGGFAAVLKAAHRKLDNEKSSATFDMANVVGWAIGAKRCCGKYTGDLAIKVYVRRKVVSGRVSNAAKVPPDVDGIPTDVIQMGRIRASGPFGYIDRPVPYGSPIANYRVPEGTLGCLVILDDNKFCILSNNHILAALNEGQDLSDPILQPGPLDFAPFGIPPGDDRLRNDLRYRIGVLLRYKPIVFASDDPNAVNLIDAAVAWTTEAYVKAAFPDSPPGYILTPSPVMGAVHNTVQKYGCESGLTIGEIVDVNASVTVTYQNGKVAVFHQQYKIEGRSGLFAVPGDSGALVALVGSDGNRPLALQFATDLSTGFSFANPIDAVMRELGIKRFLSQPMPS